MKKNYRHKKIIIQISKETGLNEQVIRLIIKKFYFGLKKTLLNNEEVNIKGFFKIKLKTHYKNKIKKLGKEINLRPRKNKKQYYVKKSKKT